MTLLERLLSVLAAYQAGHGINETQVSKRIFDNSKKLSRLRDGTDPGDVTTSTYERAMQYASDHWPEGAKWPRGVDRPKAQVSK